MDINEIKNQLSLDEIESLLSFLGAEPHKQNDNIIIAKTICHCGNSHKLFYYNNTKLFRCYTECSDIFDIGQLIIKVKHNEGTDITLQQAVIFLKNFFNLVDNKSEDFFNEQRDNQDFQILNRYLENTQNTSSKQIVELKKYDNKILNFLPKPRILPWEHEGICNSVIQSHNICYNPASQAIVIPHYDKDNSLIGIRERTLIKENEIYGKYRPLYINKHMYNHPLGFNLYNLNMSKNNIELFKKVIIFEGEKSPLLYASYFGKENDISVACCGSNISMYQMQLLLDLGVNEVIIAFDKQFKTIGDDEFHGWIKKLTDINNKYNKYVNITFMFDKWNLLNYKDSPIDKGKEIFLELFKRRFSI